jgi:hypothetical protein
MFSSSSDRTLFRLVDLSIVMERERGAKRKTGHNISFQFINLLKPSGNFTYRQV